MPALVSVIIPAYRCEATLLRSFRSLLGQTHAEWEALVVSDDGVDYAHLAAKSGLDDPRIKHIMSGGIGTGPQAARNVALALSQGAFIAPLDADDLYLPRRLERLLPLAERSGAAFDGLRVVDETDGLVLQHYFDSGEDFLLDAEGFLDLPVPMMPLVRRDWVEGWDEAIDLCDDLAFNLKIFARLAEIPVAAEILHEYRVREGSICHSPDSAERAEAGYTALLDRLDQDGYGLGDPGLIALAKERIGAKRALNQGFRAAFEAGEVATFEAYLAAGGA